MVAGVCCCSPASCRTPPACTKPARGEAASAATAAAAAAESACMAASHMRSVRQQAAAWTPCSSRVGAGADRRPVRPSSNRPAACCCCSQPAARRPRAPVPPDRAHSCPSPIGVCCSGFSAAAAATGSSLAARCVPADSCWPWQLKAASQACCTAVSLAPAAAGVASSMPPAVRRTAGSSLDAQRSIASSAALRVAVTLLVAWLQGARAPAAPGAVAVRLIRLSPLATADWSSCMAPKQAACPAPRAVPPG